MQRLGVINRQDTKTHRQPPGAGSMATTDTTPDSPGAYQDYNEGLLAFLGDSPTPFHATGNLGRMFTGAGFTELDERDEWNVQPGRYFIRRNGSSIIAMVVGTEPLASSGIRMAGAHTDSPCLKLKPNARLQRQGYLQLGVEVYGGVLLNPWFDRDLSMAGRVTALDTAGNLKNFLIDFERPVATIPSLAIHLDRDVNNARSINAQEHLPPVLMTANEDAASVNDLLRLQLAAQYPDVGVEDILDHEISFYDTQRPAINGFNGDFIASARLDNLLSCYTGATSLMTASRTVSSLFVANDHEEVGSSSAAGANGPFLAAFLERVCGDPAMRHRAIARSLMISTDNAHGIHPNYPGKHDGNHGPLLNAGPVIKVNANQRYATNSETSAFFRSLSRAAGVACQSFVTRSDMACGSTIGPITAAAIGVRTLDVGVPTFAMHSIRELAGAADAHNLHRVLTRFYQHEGPLGVD